MPGEKLTPGGAPLMTSETLGPSCGEAGGFAGEGDEAGPETGLAEGGRSTVGEALFVALPEGVPGCATEERRMSIGELHWGQPSVLPTALSETGNVAPQEEQRTGILPAVSATAGVYHPFFISGLSPTDVPVTPLHGRA